VGWQIYVGAGECDSFGFQELALELGVRIAEEDAAAAAEDAVPGDSAAGWAGGHCASGGACATREAEPFG
jgi:hypothetical protein